MDIVQCIFEPKPMQIPERKSEPSRLDHQFRNRRILPRELSFKCMPDFRMIDDHVCWQDDAVAKLYSSQIHVYLETDSGKRFLKEFTELNSDSWHCVMNGYLIREGLKGQLEEHRYELCCEMIQDQQEQFSGFWYPPHMYTAIQTGPGMTLDRLMRIL